MITECPIYKDKRMCAYCEHKDECACQPTDGVIWGDITGDLSDQTDLAAYIREHSGGCSCEAIPQEVIEEIVNGEYDMNTEEYKRLLARVERLEQALEQSVRSLAIGEVRTVDEDEEAVATMEIRDRVGYLSLSIPRGKRGLNGQDGKDGVAGTKGDKGEDGKSPLFRWEGTGLQMSTDGGLQWSEAVDLRGEKGDKGESGERGTDGITPQFRWDGTSLQISTDSGLTYNEKVELAGTKGDKGDKGTDGKDGKDGKTPILSVNSDNMLIITAYRDTPQALNTPISQSLKGERGETGNGSLVYLGMWDGNSKEYVVGDVVEYTYRSETSAELGTSRLIRYECIKAHTSNKDDFSKNIITKVECLRTDYWKARL